LRTLAQGIPREDWDGLMAKSASATRRRLQPEQFVERYRSVIGQSEMATHEAHRAEVLQAVDRLRERWKEWQGEVSLHEMAFGEP